MNSPLFYCISFVFFCLIFLEECWARIKDRDMATWIILSLLWGVFLTRESFFPFFYLTTPFVAAALGLFSAEFLQIPINVFLEWHNKVGKEHFQWWSGGSLN